MASLLMQDLIVPLLLALMFPANEGQDGSGSTGTTGLTIVVPPGTDNCLYVPLMRGDQWGVYYQVVKGGSRNVDFYVMSPSYEYIVADRKKTWADHRFLAFENGDYVVCFDNYRSLAKRIVNFHLTVKKQDPPNSLHQKKEAKKEEVGGGGGVGRKLEHIQISVDLLRERLLVSLQIQRVLRNFLVSDHSQQQQNHFHVQMWSALMASLIMVVASAQVFIIKYLLVGREAKFCLPIY